jgi:hypothetical protein
VTGVRPPALAVAIGGAVAVGGLLLAAATGPPYLSSGGVNGWIVVFALGLFAALFAAPFLIEGGLRESRAEADARWDYALPLWGLIAVAVLGLGLLIGLGNDFASDSLAGSSGLLMVIEGSLVVITLVAVVLSG